MTPRPALLKRALRAALVLVACAASVEVGAKPLDLSSDAGVAELAQWLTAYRTVSRARWVIAASDRATADAKRAALAGQLAPRDLDLMQRIDIQTTDGPPRAWMSPVFGQSNGNSNCAWQVWIDDPLIPGPGPDPVMTPLAPNDRAPVSASATFRVGHAGLVQSHLYAFGETQSGSVRDLATAPDVNIPVTRDPDGETIVLAAARQPAPFFENVKTALAQSQGERIALGPRFDLRQKMMGGGRGIGANIQAIPDSMIASPTAPANAAPSIEPAQTTLLEACVYQMTPHN